MKKLNRRQAREVAVQFLYQIEMNKEDFASNFAMLKEENPRVDLEDEYLSDILKGTYEQKEKIDSIVDENIDDWKMSRIAKVESNIIRLAMYEILNRDDIPTAVAIDEAIELVKSFSDQKAAGFVNGVLGKVVDKLELDEEE